MSAIAKRSFSDSMRGAATGIYLTETDSIKHFSGLFLENKNYVLKYNKRFRNSAAADKLFSLTEKLISNFNANLI